jgi:hypothetical protein
MRQQYQDVNFRSDTLALIDLMNDIVDEYVDQGFRLTVRQLYYQLVARAIIENTERSYKRTTSIVNDARMAGLMDWDAIEDRTRAFIRRTRWESASEILLASARSFHLDMWETQPTRVFCIVEKEALAGVLQGICNRYDIPLLAARGYPSGTVLREFAESDIIPYIDDQHIEIIHLGDHDPSGIDMTRDLRERIRLFGSSNDVSLTRIALTMNQINEQKPPPNPAKTTDSRFMEYRRRYGSESWELDALQPQYLASLVEREAKKHIDNDAWQERITETNQIKERIEKVAREFQ